MLIVILRKNIMKSYIEVTMQRKNIPDVAVLHIYKWYYRNAQQLSL